MGMKRGVIAKCEGIKASGWWLVAGGWWLGGAYGAGSRIGIGIEDRGAPDGAGSRIGIGTPGGGLPHCHFDRNAVEWRNLTAQWCRPHYGGRSLGSELQ